MKQSTRPVLLHPRRDVQQAAATLALLSFVAGVIVGMNL